MGDRRTPNPSFVIYPSKDDDTKLTIATVVLDRYGLSNLLANLRVTCSFFVFCCEVWLKKPEKNESRPPGEVKDMPGHTEAVTMQIWNREQQKHRFRRRAISRDAAGRGTLAPQWEEQEVARVSGLLVG